MTWKVSQEMLWKVDPVVSALSDLPGWRDFHRTSGKSWLYFDRMERSGKQYTCVAYTLTGNPRRTETHLATGRGAGPLQAMVDAYRQCGIVVPDAEPLLAAMLTPVDFTDLLGDPKTVTDEFEDLFA